MSDRDAMVAALDAAIERAAGLIGETDDGGYARLPWADDILGERGEFYPDGAGDGLRAAYRVYARAADGAGSVQSPAVQQLVEAVYAALAAAPRSET